MQTLPLHADDANTSNAVSKGLTIYVGYLNSLDWTTGLTFHLKLDHKNGYIFVTLLPLKVNL